ncbi:Protein-tyrosine-phosphatase [Nocardia amikacinitolerans]|uniref:Protein-tyrosine-phosphatase n=1 Tax=Nocardia amikacinitolerans TaxID=756689 RepID=A0A285LZY7_9NOCA|nr:arsenate reductase ArsC [Nocardia amikacinitolerans]SNY88851.1 Protein-tyrosine-phosphatase [Nocardia amikacinitolerans]
MERSVTPTGPAYRLLALDHETQLNAAEKRLLDEFATMFTPETVVAYLFSSYEEFLARATVTLYLPTLAEKFARQQLDAKAKLEGKVAQPRPTVLFLCTHNAGRSQIALGFFTHLARGRAVAWSGGSEPSSRLNPAAVDAMAEIGIAISGEYPKPWTEEIVRAADVIVTMGCGDTCPLVPGPRYLEWIIEDPAGLELEDVRPIRDDVGRRVEGLLAELGVPVR